MNADIPTPPQLADALPIVAVAALLVFAVWWRRHVTGRRWRDHNNERGGDTRP